MKIKMKAGDRKFIEEYNYPVSHAHRIMYDTHEVINEYGSCYVIKIDNELYFMSKYDMESVNLLPEDLFTI